VTKVIKNSFKLNLILFQLEIRLIGISSAVKSINTYDNVSKDTAYCMLNNCEFTNSNIKKPGAVNISEVENNKPRLMTSVKKQ